MLISLLFLYLLIHVNCLQKKKDADWILSFIGACIIEILFLYGITEMLSVFYLLERIYLLYMWSGFYVILFLLLTMRKRRLPTWIYIRNCVERIRYIKLVHVLVIVFSVFMLFFAFGTVPYNYDSMTYHLPRICHWVQNRSVAHYSTNVIRQVTSPVLHEFINLHIYILLNKKDNWLNLLQCYSYLINAGMVYSIAKKLECRRIFCYIAALLYCSMPIAFAEAFTTQNDNFATVWLLYFTYIIIGLTDREKQLKVDKDTILKVCMLGLLVGLGYLTKPSICVGMLVLVVWLLVVCVVRRDSIGVLIKLITVVIPAIVLPVIPEIIRNIKTFSAISAPIAGKRQLIGTIRPFYVIINFLKNFLYNLPNKFIYNSDVWLTGVVEKIAEILRVNLNDPSISEDGRAFIMHASPAYSHDVAINPAITGLMIFFAAFAILQIRKKPKNIFMSYSFVSIICFVVFCTILRWEPYVTRYMSAYLALLCPMIALQLEKRVNGETKYALMGIIYFVCITEMISMGIFHWQYIRIGKEDRDSGYFVRRVDEYEIYNNFCQIIKKEGFRVIGLKMGEEDFEYPLWKMLENGIDRIEHIEVENDTVRYQEDDMFVDCVIWIGELPSSMVEQGGKKYYIQKSFEGKYFLLY